MAVATVPPFFTDDPDPVELKHWEVYLASQLRKSGGGWTATVHRDGDRFELPTLSAEIAVADLYDGILDSAGKSLLR